MANMGYYAYKIHDNVVLQPSSLGITDLELMSYMNVIKTLNVDGVILHAQITANSGVFPVPATPDL